MAVVKVIKQVLGILTEVASIETSTGAPDASKLVNTNSSGFLDSTIVNATVSSAGAGSAGKVTALDPSGKLDTSVLPVGVGPDVKVATASETIAAGAFVNFHNSSGLKVRNADASNGRQAHGYSLLGGASASSVTCYLEGTNTAVSGKTPGATQFLSNVTPGASTETAPVTSGQIIQVIGVALLSTEISFEPESSITLA